MQNSQDKPVVTFRPSQCGIPFPIQGFSVGLANSTDRNLRALLCSRPSRLLAVDGRN